MSLNYTHFHPHLTDGHYYENQQYPIEVINTPSGSAVTLSEAKDFLREDRDIENALITSLVTTAEGLVEQYSGYKLLNTDYRIHQRCFENIRIPYKPYVSGSTVVKYDDKDGNEQTLSSSEYTVYKQEDPVRIDFHGTMPDLYTGADNDYPVRIDFTVGYGTDEDSVPDSWKDTIKLITLIYHKRSMPTDSDTNLNPMDVKMIKQIIFNRKTGKFH